MSPGDQHLTREQIESLIEFQPGGTGPHARPEPSDEARHHLDVCEECQRLVRMQEEIDRKLRDLKDHTETTRGDCAPLQDWLELAAGILPEGRVEKLLEHAAACGHCGLILRNAIEDLAAGPVAEEQLVLARLESANQAWQANLAQALLVAQPPSRTKTKEKVPVLKEAAHPGIPFPKWIYAAAALFIAALAVAGLFLQLRKPSAEKLLAQAYFEQRTLETRIPGAPYAPLRVERGSERSRFQHPAALLEAEAIIATNLAQHPDDSHWLQLKARSDLLEGNYRSALQSLQRALDSQPQSAPLLIDQASAFYLRAEMENRAADYGNAVESLGQALAKNPDDPIALFNRATAYERIFLYSQAIDDWKHYLRVAPSGGWAEEARRRLQSLNDKVKENQRGISSFQSEPRLFLDLVKRTGNATGSEADRHADEYLSVAVSRWLPAAFPETRDHAALQSGHDAREALASLANQLSGIQHDPWLSDLFARSSSEKFSDGALALSRAAEANSSGKPAVALPLARQAVKLFKQAGSVPGKARAGFEEVYALHHLAQARQCLDTANSLGPLLARRSYIWLRIQVLLEEGSCLAMLDNLDAASHKIQSAMSLLPDSSFRNLNLRVMSFAASMEQLAGRTNSAWSLQVAGLAACWNGPCYPLRAFQFYDELDILSDKMGEHQLAASMAREASRTVDLSGNPSAAAMAHNRLANLDYQVQLFDEAKREIERSQDLFNQLPRDKAAEFYRLEGEIELANIESATGKLDGALARLLKLKPSLIGIENYALFIRYYRSLCELESKRQQSAAAKKALLTAIAAGEWGLQTISDERGRIVWTEELSPVYRDLVRLELRDQTTVGVALETWESFLGAPLRAARDSRIEPGFRVPKTIDFNSVAAAPALPVAGEVLAMVPRLTKATVLSFSELSDGIAVWVFDNRGVSVHWLSVPPALVNAAVRRFHEECADPQASQKSLGNDARLLYHWLLAPVASQLQTERVLIFELDRPLGDLPLPVLMDPSGHCLWERFAMVVSPGLLYQPELRPEISFSPKLHALILGSSAPGSDASNAGAALDAAREATAIADFFRGPMLFTGSQATREEMEKNLAKSDLFHFAGHAIESPQGVGLVFASSNSREDEESIFASDRIRGLQFEHCQLAVLSACATAQAGEQGIADPDSLVRALLRAGVPHVLASRWNVDSATTCAFMRLFYKDLFEGKQVSIALQDAGMQIRSQPATSHPYYWAAFAAFGRT